MVNFLNLISKEHLVEGLMELKRVLKDILDNPELLESETNKKKYKELLEKY